MLSAGTVATFLVAVTPAMHDVWAVPDEQQEGQFVNFLETTELLGAALAFLALGDRAWGLALNVGLWT